MLQGEYDASMTTRSELAVTGGTGHYTQASGSSTLSFDIPTRYGGTGGEEGEWNYDLRNMKCSN